MPVNYATAQVVPVGDVIQEIDQFLANECDILATQTKSPEKIEVEPITEK